MTRPVLYFVRHGETDWNKQGRLQGTRDIPLNPLGRVQAEEAGHRISRRVPDPGDLDYVASPMLRTRETMAILRAKVGLDPARFRTDPRLAELGFGDWEGMTWREIRGRHPAAARARDADKWNFVPPGGESYAALQDRILPAIDALTRDTVLVSHGGVARALLRALAAVPEAEAPRTDIWQGRVLVFSAGNSHWA